MHFQGLGETSQPTDQSDRRSVLTSFADKGSFVYIEITAFAYFVKPLRINIDLTHTINFLQ